MTAQPKFYHGNVVLHQMKLYRICGIRAYQSEHFRPECWMYDYILEPIEFVGFEHDEEIEVGESTLTLVRCHYSCSDIGNKR